MQDQENCGLNANLNNFVPDNKQELNNAKPLQVQAPPKARASDQVSNPGEPETKGLPLAPISPIKPSREVLEENSNSPDMPSFNEGFQPIESVD